MTATIPKPDDRLEWLAARKPFFNASDAGCLYGAHPHRSLADVAIDKLDPEVSEAEQTEAMERGNRLEPMLLEWFGDRNNVYAETPNVLYTNGRLMATLDGVVPGNEVEWIEIKTTSQRWSDVPEHVYWQVAAQAGATGRTRCHVVWIDADMRFKEQVITPDPSHVVDVLDRSAHFMAFIDLGMLPEGVEMTAEHLAKLYPSPVEGKYVDLDSEQRFAVEEWETRRLVRVAAEKAEKAAKDAVATMFDDAEGLRYNGRLIATWKAANRTSLDSKRLKEENPKLVEKYQRTIPVRTLRATKELFA